ncbi:MAG TPA: hypothetical protein VI522_08765, partial [Gammaproteobacteria bacterium]|nr:hypothetical protein [Gammaproteobacteria bacterium]
LLSAHDFPYPKGEVFVSAKKALRYGMQLGFPLVVKPAHSSLSRHVTINVQSESELRVAIRIAKQVNYRILVEQYIPGDVYRALILDGQWIACAKREAGSVVGNGKDTIDKLIEEKNKHPLRGEPGSKNHTLFKIMKTRQLEKILVKQDVRLHTKLDKGKQIFLSEKVNAGNGADITNVMQCHPENMQMLIKVQQTLGLPLAAIDFICRDMTRPFYQQPFALIENNSLPYIDMHHFPHSGPSVDVAKHIWDFVLSKLA